MILYMEIASLQVFIIESLHCITLLLLLLLTLACDLLCSGSVLPIPREVTHAGVFKFVGREKTRTHGSRTAWQELEKVSISISKIKTTQTIVGQAEVASFWIFYQFASQTFISKVRRDERCPDGAHLFFHSLINKYV